MGMKNEAIFNIAYFVIMFVFSQSLIVSLQIATGQIDDGMLENVNIENFQNIADLQEAYGVNQFNTSSWSLTDGIQDDDGLVSQIIGMTTNVQGYVYNMAEKIQLFCRIIFSIQTAQLEIFLIPAIWSFEIMGLGTAYFSIFSTFITLAIYLLIFFYIIRFFVGFVRGY